MQKFNFYYNQYHRIGTTGTKHQPRDTMHPVPVIRLRPPATRRRPPVTRLQLQATKPRAPVTALQAIMLQVMVEVESKSFK